MIPYKSTKYLQRILYVLTSGTILWLLLIILAPILKSSDVKLLNHISGYLYFLFEPVCHQIPERSLFLNSAPLAVCTRCFAIYLGAFLILVFFVVRKTIHHINPNWVVLYTVPTIMDFLFEKFGLYLNLPVVRFLTGLLFGASLIYLILYSILDIKNEYLTKWKFYYGKSEIN